MLNTVRSLIVVEKQEALTKDTYESSNIDKYAVAEQLLSFKRVLPSIV